MNGFCSKTYKCIAYLNDIKVTISVTPPALLQNFEHLAELQQ